MERIYFDANIFLNPILYEIDQNDLAQKANVFLGKIVEGTIEAYTSLLTWDEVSYILLRTFDRAFAQQKSRTFLNFPNLNFLPVNQRIIQKAQDLMGKYPINPRDAIHAATALLHQIEKFASFDQDFKKIPVIHLIPEI